MKFSIIFRRIHNFDQLGRYIFSNTVVTCAKLHLEHFYPFEKFVKFVWKMLKFVSNISILRENLFLPKDTEMDAIQVEAIEFLFYLFLTTEEWK